MLVKRSEIAMKKIFSRLPFLYVRRRWGNAQNIFFIPVDRLEVGRGKDRGTSMCFVTVRFLHQINRCPFTLSLNDRTIVARSCTSWKRDQKVTGATLADGIERLIRLVGPSGNGRGESKLLTICNNLRLSRNH